MNYEFKDFCKDWKMIKNEIDEEHEALLIHIANVIKKARKKAGLKQSNFGEFGYSERMMVKLESGTNEPTLKTILKLSAILDIPLQKFFSFKK